MKKATIVSAAAGIAVTAFAAPSVVSANTVVVASGDTLWGIASKTGTTVDQLKQLNKLDSDRIVPGQKLTIKEVAAQKVEKSVSATWLNVRHAPDANEKILTSLKGGTVVKVESSEANGWNKISFDNGKTGYVNGKYLSDAKVAAPVVTKAVTHKAEAKVAATSTHAVKVDTNASTYKVKSGDTIWALSVKYGVPVQKLIEWNNLSSSSIYVGQTIAVKEAAAKAAPTTVKQAAPAKIAPKQEVKQTAPAKQEQAKPAAKETVKPAVSKPKAATPAPTAKPAVEQKASTPAVDTSAATYKVQNGDSLGKIASLFKVSVADLTNWNNLNATSTIYAGQELSVKASAAKPKPAAPAKPAVSKPATSTPAKVTPTNTTNNSTPTTNVNNNTSQSSSASFSALYAEAKKHLGKPYTWGARGPSTFDCSGFTSYVFNQVGLSLSGNSATQYANSTKISESQAQPGDLVFFNYGSGIAHVGIYIGGGQMIDAQDNGVSIDNIHGNGWGQYLVGFGRVANF